MRRKLLALPVLLLPAACHESAIEPRVPDQVWDEHPAEAAYAMAPAPAVVNPAPAPRVPLRRSISLGFIGDAPLTEAEPVGPHWPYVQEPFRYHEPYPTPHGFALRGGHWSPVRHYGYAEEYSQDASMQVRPVD